MVAPPPVAIAAPFADSSLNQISLEYTYTELRDATRNFSESMKLGAGSYGGVYKGVLLDGTEVAIKVLDVPDEAGFEEEVKVLSKFRHPHLVILMGFARHGPQRLLVYEMLAGGDVHKRLQRSCLEGVPCLWHERVSIALDAACGLSHLHHSTPKVFHRDIKTPNILLDKNGTAKMADFGLACLSNASAHRVKQASGTVGYACPLYVQRGVVTEGSEVYSFGMVLLELLTASPPAYMGPPEGGGAGGGGAQIQYLANHINGSLRTALSLADAKANWPPQIARTLCELALSCIRMREERRPNFAEMVRNLRALNDSASSMKSGPSVPPSLQLNPMVGQAATSMAPMGVGAGARAASPNTPSPVHTPVLPPAVAPLPPSPNGHSSVGSHQRQSRTPPQRPPLTAFGDAFAVDPVALAGSPSSALGGSPASGASFMPPSRQTFQQPALLPTPKASGQTSQLSGHAWPLPAAQTFVMQAAPPMPQAPQRYSPSAASSGPKAVPVEVQMSHSKQFYAPSSMPPLLSTGLNLFRLELTFSEGMSLEDVGFEKRSIVHVLPPQDMNALTLHSVKLPCLHIGRVHQSNLFDNLVVGTAARSTVSREHFRICVEKSAEQQLDDDKTNCTIYLENCSGNGTHVNNHYLTGRGDRAVLHHGDCITLSRTGMGADGSPYQARILQFAFLLPSDSCLREDLEEDYEDEEDAEGWDDDYSDASEDSECSSTQLPRPSGGLPRGPLHQSALDLGGYRDGDLAFVLEVCGQAVRYQVPVEQRRIAYAPPPRECEDMPRLFNSLVIGRAHQLDFWQEVLRDGAFNTLSRQHFEIQTWRSPGAVAPFSFLVRNLSDVNPVHVRSGPEETAEDPPSLLQRGEQRHLLDGDEIVLNIDQEHTFWLIFRDLTASTHVAVGLEEHPNLAGGTRSSASQADTALMTMPLAGVAAPAEQARMFGSSWRSPNSFSLKDEDEISTTATPMPGDMHDAELLYQEEEEEERLGADADGQDEDVAFGGYGAKLSGGGGAVGSSHLAARCSMAGPPVPRGAGDIRSSSHGSGGSGGSGREVPVAAVAVSAATSATARGGGSGVASFNCGVPSIIGAVGRGYREDRRPTVSSSAAAAAHGTAGMHSLHPQNCGSGAPAARFTVKASSAPRAAQHGGAQAAANATAGPFRHAWVAPQAHIPRATSPYRRLC